jgi:hypothetical protein
MYKKLLKCVNNFLNGWKLGAKQAYYSLEAKRKEKFRNSAEAIA